MGASRVVLGHGTTSQALSVLSERARGFSQRIVGAGGGGVARRSRTPAKV